ncbi:MAG TPA: hypothetical protein VEX60_02010 [Pyrinomonadaceae bacterium]|nr:hypothetical protein [Pyrinomonadaceae bacterium]
MNPYLMQAVVEQALFLALSGDDVVHPDAAVTQLEQMASILDKLTPEEREIFVRYVEGLARTEQSRAGKAGRAEFLLSLPDCLGLRD